MLQDSRADPCYDAFEREWSARTAALEGVENPASKRPLVKTLAKLYGKRFIIGGFFKLGWSTLVIAGAFFFVRSLLRFVDEDDQDHPFNENWKGWVLAFFFFVSATIWGARLALAPCVTCVHFEMIQVASPPLRGARVTPCADARVERLVAFLHRAWAVSACAANAVGRSRLCMWPELHAVRARARPRGPPLRITRARLSSRRAGRMHAPALATATCRWRRLTRSPSTTAHTVHNR